MKSAQDLAASLRRKITLNIADQKNQDAKQNRNLEYIIDEKQHAPADTRIRIKAKSCQHGAEQGIQPFHTQYLILDKTPDHLHSHFPSSQPSFISQSKLPIKRWKSRKVSQFKE